MTPTSTETQQRTARQGTESLDKARVGFLHQSREEQIRCLLDWLPPDFRDLPGITWENVSGRIIRYLVKTVKKAAHAPHLALFVGKAQESMGTDALRGMTTNLHSLLSFLHKHCNAGDDLQLTREVWERYISLTAKNSRRRCLLVVYSSATEIHLPDYVEQLDATTRAKIAPYLLPRLPARFLEQHGAAQEIRIAQEKRRKERSDILVPLHSILVALIQFRKQEAQRLLQAFHGAVQRAEAGEAIPLTFGYEEILTRVLPEAQTVAEFRLEKRNVFLTFRLWNRRG